MGLSFFFFLLPVFMNRVALPVDMRWSWYCAFTCVLSAHDWIRLHSSLLHLWLQKFGILSNKWPQHQCNVHVSSLGTLSRCHEVVLCCVQTMAASSFTHNPDPLGVLLWSLCSNVVVELYAWMILRTSVEDTVGLDIEWGGGWGWFLKRVKFGLSVTNSLLSLTLTTVMLMVATISYTFQHEVNKN